MKLPEGVTVVIGGKKYRDEVPDKIAAKYKLIEKQGDSKPSEKKGKKG